MKIYAQQANQICLQKSTGHKWEINLAEDTNELLNRMTYPGRFPNAVHKSHFSFGQHKISWFIRAPLFYGEKIYGFIWEGFIIKIEKKKQGYINIINVFNQSARIKYTSNRKSVSPFIRLWIKHAHGMFIVYIQERIAILAMILTAFQFPLFSFTHPIPPKSLYSSLNTDPHTTKNIIVIKKKQTLNIRKPHHNHKQCERQRYERRKTDEMKRVCGVARF